MAWDSSRPVDWTQLVRSWLIYVAIMAVLFLVMFRDRPLIGIFAGRWLDDRFASGSFFTAPFLMLGTGLGCWTAWRWIGRA